MTEIQKREEELDAQHQRDLETLDRIEHQNECFFDVMGERDAECLGARE